MRWWGVSVAVEVASSRWRLQPSDGGSVLPAAGYIHSAAASSSRPRIHPRDGGCIPRFRLHPLAVCSISGSPATIPRRRLEPLAACSVLGSPATSPRRLFHPRAPDTSPRRQLHTTASVQEMRRLHPRGGGGIPSKTTASPQQWLHLPSWATSPLHHVSMATFPQFRLHLPWFLLHPMQGYQGRKGSADDTLPHPTLPALTAAAAGSACGWW
ncbi:uncharacterized protein LOC124695812 [Lolium rigidum]|uniref:uncharacterized protein LOC124695812 n=1 Tax=Lolium rigidum TaxID=89674 RepID=UPI001F5D2DBF|nr:uncharacterized protein LOC124695812 [Lolium rigidum]